MRTGEHLHLDASGIPHSHDHHHTTITLEHRILAENDRLAERNRGWLAGRGAFAVNMMSGPGAGKTTILERTLHECDKMPFCVIEGDLETTRDAERIRATGRDVVQVNTGEVCHLDAAMVHQALLQLDPVAGSIVVIENVGNLVCPAMFDLGQDVNVVVASVTDGDDKPEKYPHMFRKADLVLLNKCDLLPHVSFDSERFSRTIAHLNPKIRILKISATTGFGLPEWFTWLDEGVIR